MENAYRDYILNKNEFLITVQCQVISHLLARISLIINKIKMYSTELFPGVLLYGENVGFVWGLLDKCNYDAGFCP